MQADEPGAARLEAAMQKSVAAAKSLDPALEPRALYVLADLRAWQGRFAEEYKIADAALAQLGPGDTQDSLLDRARLTGSKAEALYYQGKANAALPLYREGLALVEQAYDRAPDNNYLLLRRAVWRWQVGSTLLELQKFGEALVVLDSGLADAERGQRFDPSDQEARRNVRVLATARAQAFGLLGRTEQEIATLRKVVQADQAVLNADQGNPRAHRDVVYDHAAIGEALDRAGLKSAACAQDRATLTLYANLQRRGILTRFDVADNRNKVESRIARNCPS